MKINNIKNSTVDYDIREIAYWTSKGIEIEGKTYPIENFSIKETGLFATIVLDDGQLSDHLIAGNAGYDGGPTEAELATKQDSLIPSTGIVISETNEIGVKDVYTHEAYAYSADGTDRFSTTFPTIENAKPSDYPLYKGLLVDFNSLASEHPEDYEWSINEAIVGVSGVLPITNGGTGTSDGVINTIAYANSADGTDSFSPVFPNSNLLDGTKDFSGAWTNSNTWVTDGTYKGLTVKKRTGQWSGIYKTFTAPKDGTYTFSAYVKGSGSTASIYRQVSINGGSSGSVVPNKLIGNKFDWLRDSFKVTLKAGDIIYAKYEISSTATDSILWTAGHKWEYGSIVTDDYPKYVGFSNIIKPNKTSSDYIWLPMEFVSIDSITDLQSQITTNKTSITNTSSRIDNLVLTAGNGNSSEVSDIRLGFDGKTYVTAGDAVRKQLLGLNEKLTKTTNPDGNKLVLSKYDANNLINKNDLIAGYYISNTGIMTQSADWYATDYIDVSENVYINSQNGVGLSSWYDSDKNFVSSFTPNGPVSVPVGAKYIRSSILNTHINTAYIVDGQRNVEGVNADLNGYPLITKKPYRDGFQKFTVKTNRSKPVDTTANDINYEGTTFEDVDCHLYMPSNFYSPFGKPSKLLMLCHGAGRGAIEWQSVPNYVSMVKAFSSNGYFVFDCNGFSNDVLGCSFWGDQRGLTAWRKAYQYVTDNYNVEKEFSVYAFSMGGLTALNLAFQGLPNVKSIALGSPITNLEAVFRSTDGTKNVIKALYGLGDTWEESKVKGSNPFANIITIGDKNVVLKTLPPIKIWYGGTETGNTGNPAIEKDYAKQLVDAIVAGGGTAEYREVANGIHSLSYGGNAIVTNEIITYLNRFSWGGE